MDDLDKMHQTISMSGVWAYGQNGVAERAIRAVVVSARTMMLHQALLWPAHFDMRFWPFTLEHVVYVWNHLPDGGFLVVVGIAPIEIYTYFKLDMSRLRDEKTWGCPVYVLDLRIQDGKNIPKW